MAKLACICVKRADIGSDNEGLSPCYLERYLVMVNEGKKSGNFGNLRGKSG